MGEDAALTTLTDRIAAMLAEIEAEPRTLLFRLVVYSGAELSERLLSETLRILSAGGMPTKNGARQRTPGGGRRRVECGGWIA
jgi:hypothetical protein